MLPEIEYVVRQVVKEQPHHSHHFYMPMTGSSSQALLNSGARVTVIKGSENQLNLDIGWLQNDSSKYTREIY